MPFYIAGDCVYNAANFRIAVYIDSVGYTVYGADRPIETYGIAEDPFWSLGVDTESWTYGVKQAEIGLLKKSRIKFGKEGGVESVWGWDIVGLGWVDLIAGGGVAHNRLHNMANAFDHNSANKWKMWYADGAGPPAVVQELALGSAGQLIVSQGAAVAPIFSKLIIGCNNEANALIISDGVVQVKIWCDGADTHIKTDSGDIILDPAGGDVTLPGASKVWDACWN